MLRKKNNTNKDKEKNQNDAKLAKQSCLRHDKKRRKNLT